MTSKTTTVRNRRVFYVPGYDPFPPRRYRELYRREGTAQADISGYELSLEARPAGASNYSWQVNTTIDEVSTRTRVDVLVWADLVQASMQRGILGTYVLLARTFWAFAGSGAFLRLLRLRPQPMLAASWPIVALLGQLLIAVLTGYALAWGLAYLIPGPMGWPLGLVAGWVWGVYLLRQFRRWDPKLYAYYLLYDFAHTAAHNGAYGAKLSARLDEFASEVQAALADPELDEVLVVGHSSGASLAVSLLARVLRAQGEAHPALGLLTLGHAIPVQSYLPRALELRGDLAFVSKARNITWVDVTAQGDGCAFALCDPVAVSGMASPEQRWPLVLSAAFSESLKPETLARLKWRFFLTHFQYLAAFDAPRDYDYFQITAGPRTLAARYAGRAHSPSRVTRVLTGYRSTK